MRLKLVTTCPISGVLDAVDWVEISSLPPEALEALEEAREEGLGLVDLRVCEALEDAIDLGAYGNVTHAAID